MAFALLLPFVARGERVDVLGVSLSSRACSAAWNMLAKGTLGVVAAILLSATTGRATLLAGLERLRLPSRLVAILAFMLRYVEVVPDELRRMRIARESRGYTARSVRQLGGRRGRRPAHCSSASYERGERVHLAMLARGYTGAMPAARRRRGAAASLGAAAPAGRRRGRARDRRTAGGERRAVSGRAGGRSGLVLRLPGRLPGAVRRRLRGRPRRAGRAARAERRRQDHARPAPQRHPAPAGPGAVRGRRAAGRPASTCRRCGGGSASSSRTRTTSCSCRRCARTSPSARRTSGCAAPSSTSGCDGRWTQVGMQDARRPGAAPPQLRPAPAGRGGDGAGDGARGAGAGRAVAATWTRRAGASWPRSCSGWT